MNDWHADSRDEDAERRYRVGCVKLLGGRQRGGGDKGYAMNTLDPPSTRS
jgi:hypothetical protein